MVYTRSVGSKCHLNIICISTLEHPLKFISLYLIPDFLNQNLFCGFWLISCLSSLEDFLYSQFANHVTYKCFSKFTLQESMRSDYCYLPENFSKASQQLSVPSHEKFFACFFKLIPDKVKYDSSYELFGIQA